MDIKKDTARSVVLLDSHAALRDDLECLIEGTDDLSVVGSVATVTDLSICLNFIQADVVVMGLVFDGADGLRCIADMSAAHPEIRILVLSQLPEAVCAERVLNAGASGYLMKHTSAADLFDGIRRIAVGEVVLSSTMASHLLVDFSKHSSKNEADVFDRLTDRELHVLHLVGQGHATARIADQMGISKQTVSTFKERIKTKLSLTSSLPLAQAAMQQLGSVQSYELDAK